MSDINKCDIVATDKAALTYEFREGMTWERLREDLKKDFSFYFEPIELPVVELKEEFSKKEYIIKKDGRNWLIVRYFENSESFSVWIGGLCTIKSIEDFNNRAARLFGFYLKEPEGGK